MSQDREEALKELEEVGLSKKTYNTIRKALEAKEPEVSNTIHEQQIYNSMMYATKKFIDDLRLKGIIIIKEKSDE